MLTLINWDYRAYRNTISYQRKLWSSNSVARYAVQVPPVGGDTCFADASRALATLPEAQRKRRQDTFALATFQDPKLKHAVFRFILDEFLWWSDEVPELDTELDHVRSAGLKPWRLFAVRLGAKLEKLLEQSSTSCQCCHGFRTFELHWVVLVAIKVCEVFVGASQTNPRILQPIWQFRSKLARLIMMHFIMWRNQAGLQVQMPATMNEDPWPASYSKNLQDIKHICEKSFRLTPALFLPTQRTLQTFTDMFIFEEGLRFLTRSCTNPFWPLSVEQKMHQSQQGPTLRWALSNAQRCLWCLDSSRSSWLSEEAKLCCSCETNRF